MSGPRIGLPGLGLLLALLALLALLSLLVAGCGVPSQDRPVVIDPTNVPNSLLATARPEPDSTPTPSLEAKPVTYFVEAGMLVGVERDLPHASLRPRLESAIAALLLGPTGTEQSAGLGTAIPNNLLLNVGEIHDGEVIIELTGEPRNSPTEENVLAVAQIVLTATAQPEIDRVRLTRDGEPVDAPLIGGTLKYTALTANDYAALVAGR
jgi:Sporulation and spore germination